MKRFSSGWKKKFGRRMGACAIGGSVALSSAACYAANAFDNASDPVYNDGWQAGDNGGFGFTPWNFDSDAGNANAFHAIDDGARSGTHYSNPFNNIGRAWDVGIADNGLPRAGRGFAPLEIGQSLKVVFDNPTKRQFFKGYFIRLNGGTGGTGGNICYGGAPCTLGGTPKEKMSWTRFEYFSYGQWQVNDSAGGSNTGVFDTDTAAAGALFQVTRTGADTYDLLVNSFGPGADFSASRTFANAGLPLDWIEFTFFNTPSNTATPPTEATDFYIRSMEISSVPEPTTGILLLGAMVGTAGRRRRRQNGG